MPAWVGEAEFPLSRKYSERGLSHTCSSAEMLEGCGCASRMQWLSANRSGKLNSPEPLIWPSLLPPPSHRKPESYAARGTVTETVVPGEAADVVTRPPSCRVNASTMLVPRPILTGASGKCVLIPTPLSDTDRRHALAVDSKPTTMLPLAPPGKACFSA